MLCPFWSRRFCAFFCASLPDRNSLAKNSEGFLIPGTRPPEGRNDRSPTLRVGKRVWLPIWAAAIWSSDTVLRKASAEPNDPPVGQPVRNTFSLTAWLCATRGCE